MGVQSEYVPGSLRFVLDQSFSNRPEYSNFPNLSSIYAPQVSRNHIRLATICGTRYPTVLQPRLFH